MKKSVKKSMIVIVLFFLSQVGITAGIDGIDYLQDIFTCYSASNWYGKSEKHYSSLVKQDVLNIPVILRAVCNEKTRCSENSWNVFLLSDLDQTNILIRVDIVCAGTMKLAHQAMLEYFLSCSAVHPFPKASDVTGKVGDYCYFGYGKSWTSVMFVRNNVFSIVKSLTSMSSVQQVAKIIDEEILRLSKPQESDISAEDSVDKSLLDGSKWR